MTHLDADMRPDRIDDRANRASGRVADVYMPNVHATTSDAVNALVDDPEGLLAGPSRPLDHLDITGRAPGAPRTRLPQRILSP